MQITPTAIPEVKVLSPKKFEDSRGFFSEVYSDKNLAGLGLARGFVQDNHSFSAELFTFRGLHYQEPPFAQAKLVRILAGAALDIAVDIRKGSPTYGQHVMVELRPQLWNQIFVPEGFAHAILTLEPGTEVFYKVSNYYSPQHDKGILWSDPALKLKLPVAVDKLILSDKDRAQPLLKDVKNPFVYEASR
ncbi:MAG: dTDP-4-dehydrorhamnose 3,5-epimerase [Proteobacteria bacterium]|nr:dTDP-4-dehydrorhamnose 3,5-epimerase [Pseudomonadota bacterium]